jgi:hypothetical protein
VGLLILLSVVAEPGRGAFQYDTVWLLKLLLLLRYVFEELLTCNEQPRSKISD